jgi:hypothetical protein
MSLHRTIITLVSALLLSACAASANQVNVKGADKDIVLLAGEWSGDYKGLDSGREGKIVFNLTLGRHTAEGEVLMYAKDRNEPRALKIQFVKVDDNRISGRVGPYVDPQCACEVETEFLGDVEGDVIDGTFVTRIAALNVEQAGRWSVQRNDDE